MEQLVEDFDRCGVKRWCATILVIVAAASTPCVAQTFDLHAVERAVFALYPDLKRANLLVTVVVQPQPLNGPLSPVRLTAIVDDVPRRNGSADDSRSHVLRVKLRCSRGGEVMEAIALPSPFLHTERLQDIRRSVEKQPVMSAARVAELLADAGARFGPDRIDEVKNRAATIARSLSEGNDEVHFRIVRPPQAPTGETDHNSLIWRLDMDSGSDHFSVWLEPLDGRVVRLVRSRASGFR